MDHPKVGVGVFVLRDENVLLLRRKNAHGEGTWSIPGGHLEFGERLEECAKREVMEETGLEIEEIMQGPCTNDIFESENKHYITVFMIAKSTVGEPQVREPDKCTDLHWCSWEKLPTPLFLPLQNLIKTGFSPFQ